MTHSRLWLIPVAGALLAPLVTWLPMVALRYGLGLPRYEPAQGIDIWHMQAFWFAVFGVVAVLVGRTDRWLGVAVMILGGGVFLWAGTFDITHRIVFLGGVVALWAMRQIQPEWHPMVRALLAASGIFQAVYMIQQYFGYDVLWGPLVGGTLKDVVQPLGTMGTVDAASAYVAVTAPLMPYWAVPIAVAVVLKGHSIGAIMALAVGLLVRYHRNWKLTAAIVAVLSGIYLRWFIPGGLLSAHIPTSVTVKLTMWWYGLKDWWQTAALIGPGTWHERIPMLQIQQNYRPITGEVWREAHNEYLQWLYEYGLLGFSVLCLWLWDHRAMFKVPAVGASLLALAVVTGSFFTFHVVSVALLGLVLVGLATSPTLPEEAV